MAKDRVKEAEEQRIADQDGGKDRPPVNSPLGTQEVGSPAWNAAYDEKNDKAEREAEATLVDEDSDEKEVEKAKEKVDEVQAERAEQGAPDEKRVAKKRKAVEKVK